MKCSSSSITQTPSEMGPNSISGDDPNVADNTVLEKQPTPIEETPPPPYSVLTTWEKRFMTLAVASTALFSPLSAQIYLPALTVLSEAFHVSSAQINLTITTYMIFQGIVPMFIGSLADSGGRRPAYIICFVIYIGANIGLALSPSYGAILGLRCLQSAGSSSTVALCMGVIADIITSAERGQYVGFTVLPAVLAPAIGPVIGGVLSHEMGWRSIFWFLVILSSIAVILIVLFMPETCRGIVGDGSILPPPMYRSIWQMLTHRRRMSSFKIAVESENLDSDTHRKFKFKPPNVLGSLLQLLEIETGLLQGASGIVFAGFYCVMSAMPALFKSRYGYDEITIGLMYLPMAVGSIAAAAIVGPTINWNYKRHCKKLGIPLDRSRQQDLSNFPIERVRLEIGIPLLCLTAVTMVAWGWVMQVTAHVVAHIIVSGIMSMGLIGFNNTSSALLVDIHPGRAGTVTAGSNFVRCLIGAGASAAIIPMIDALGVGWSFVLIGGMYAFCMIPLLLVMTQGMNWRAKLKAKQELKRQKKGAREGEGDQE